MHHCHTERPHRPWVAILNTRCTICWWRSFCRKWCRLSNCCTKYFGWTGRRGNKAQAFECASFKGVSAYQRIGPWDSKKGEHQTRYGVGKIWPFSFDALWTIPISANKMAWHFGRTCGWSTTTPLWSLDSRIFRGSLEERKKLDGTVNFRHTFGAASSTSGARGGWFVFVAPPERRVL